MTIPITTQEHLLRDTGELFDFGRCRICVGHFRKDVHESHLDYHRELFEQYAPERRRLATQRLDREENLGARMTCEVAGMPTVTRKKLDRHRRLYGDGGVDALEPYLLSPGLAETGSKTHGGMRPQITATHEPDSSPWGSVRTRNLGLRVVGLKRRGMMPAAIADRLNKSDVVVRRYLREASAAGLV